MTPLVVSHTCGAPRRAILHLHGERGRTTQLVEVIAEHARTYRVRALGETQTAFARRAIPVGDVRCVPKSAVAFEVEHIASVVDRVMADLLTRVEATQEADA